ncbi:MAG: exodeoxyribonuclease VII large subunit [Deltaproteobacteria bacterium]|nr:exodeoxyribonuclease VII large subunit [Deltaproteobacteria bacterium]
MTLNSSTMTVSELTRKIKKLLEERFPFVWLTGEISNFRKPASGHFYFTVKDAQAQINAVMFRGQNRRLRFEPEDGMQVSGLGRISVYEPRGTYQIIFEHLEPGGVGALQVAFEQLKKKLDQEGLFAVESKQALPFLPRHISLVTSPSGAVVHDICRIAIRRFPNIHIQIVGCKVQGAGAEEEISAAIELLNRQNRTELIILARGGGSLEDLQAYNSERVARAIFASRIPVISAVGHETDYTIADFVADMRVPTPSAAAELAVPVKADLKHTLDDLDRQLKRAFRLCIQNGRTRLKTAQSRFKDPKSSIQDYRIRIDDLHFRLQNNLLRHVQSMRERWQWRAQNLALHNPARQCNELKNKLQVLTYKLMKNINNNSSSNRIKLHAVDNALSLLNPTAILSRGYSITRTFPGKTIVRDAESVSKGQELEILLNKGSLNVHVK